MNSNDMLHADLLDIVFDGRNKEYGAYTLRKSYNRHLALALGISLSTLLLFFLLIKPGRNSETYLPREEAVVQIRDFDIRKPDIKKPVQPAAQQPRQQAARQQFTDRLQLVDRTPLTASLPPNAALTNISTVTVQGPIHADPYDGAPRIGGPAAIPAAQPAAPDVVAAVQREPEFPGGMQAWADFLNSNLRVPDELEAGEKKTVLIRFEVGADGTVAGFEVVQSAGSRYNNEVIRVLKKMPKWKPAIQNNKPVARAFTQPVIFMGVED